MKCSLQDLKKGIELVGDASERIENLDNLFTGRGPEIFTHFSEEEKKIIDASRGCIDLLLDVDCILGDLEVTMEEQCGEGSEV